jgi:hypothetical protein
VSSKNLKLNRWWGGQNLECQRYESSLQIPELDREGCQNMINIMQKQNQQTARLYYLLKVNVFIRNKCSMNIKGFTDKY